MAGPNHTLPTARDCKILLSSQCRALFKEIINYIYDRKGLEEIGRECALIANIQGLHAHKKSVTYETIDGWL